MDNKNQENSEKEENHVENKNKEMNLADITRYNLEELDVNPLLQYINYFFHSPFLFFFNGFSLMENHGNS